MRNMKYLIFVFAIVLASGPSGVYGQAAISTGDLASAAPPDATAAAPASTAGASVQDSSAAVDLSSDSSTATPAPAPAPAPALAPVPFPAPAKARVMAPAPAPAPARAPTKAPAKAPARAPSRAPAPKPAARTSLQSSAPSQAPAPGPSGGGGGNTTVADITNVVQARAATFTRANTLFLAGVTPRVDWMADLGETGRRTGRFLMDYFVSAAFNQSTPSGSAWLGNPQAVIQGVVDGGSNETSMVAILSQPRYNASADTLSFVVSPVTDPAFLKLSAGTANAALAGDPANRLNSTAVGLILKDVVIYIDDATGESAVEVSQGPGQKSSLVTFGPWGNGFGGGWNPCWGAGRRRWGDDWVRRNYFGCGGGVWFGR